MQPVTQETQQRIQFGSFELDLHARELRKHGLKVKIPPQAFCLLSCLVARPGELVTRDELIRKLWPGDTHVEFEGNLNAITRVLREALGDSARNPRFIETEPKLGYRFIAPVSVVESPPPAVHQSAVEHPAPGLSLRARWRVVLGMALLAPGIWIAWSTFHRTATPPLSSRLTQITHFLGNAGHPSFAPDGERVVFHWNGDQTGVYHIYEMHIGSGDVQRLTANAADDMYPAWSPDGRDIAFLRSMPANQSALVLASAIGSGERTVAVLPKVRSLAWSPDGRWIAYSLASPDNEWNPRSDGGISALSLSTAKTVDLTRGGGDAYPAFSPDGAALAFVRRSDVWTLPLARDLKPDGAPRRLTQRSASALNPVWSPDGKSITFVAERGEYGRLWRVPVSGGEPVEAGGEDALEPTLDSSGRRIVYSRATVVDSLNVLPLCDAGCAPEPPRKMLYSTKLARNPSFSPDGSEIAFESSRSGHMEIWLCNRDGSHPRQVTHLGGPPAGTPNWSPDGRLVFDARVPAGSAIFTIPATGGSPRQLTTGATEDLVPFWSRDGRRIYFASKRTGSLQVWAMPADGGDAIQITRGGGLRAVESFDGRYLYYTKSATHTSVWRVPVGGGEERPVIDALSFWQNFCVVPGGIYFVPDVAVRSFPIHFFDAASGATRQVGSVDALGLQGITVASKNNNLVLSRRESSDRDLMLMEFAH
jgi:Tol biopolymer transport system component/DNA-binding winged helix-turn-helix (wHTH) protein